MRNAAGSAFGAYLGIVAASLAAGIEFGIQPALYHAAGGQPLYCPYGLNIAIPVMVCEHLFLFGWIEALVTFLVIRYMQKEEIGLIQ